MFCTVLIAQIDVVHEIIYAGLFFFKKTMKLGSYAYICSHNTCGYGEIGRHARLRIWCLTVCRFESYYPHKKPLFREAFFMCSCQRFAASPESKSIIISNFRPRDVLQKRGRFMN
jgi:hypothetical protein